jgi:hypothetical protein
VIARVAAAGAVLLAATSCAGDGVVVSPGLPRGGGGAPTLSQLQSSIFTPRCARAGCHAPPMPQQGMDLSAGRTYPSTVGTGSGVDSVELSGFKRILPGHSADSYLYMKVAGDPRIAGDRMPADGTTLSNAEIAAIAAWIDAGAAND